MKPKIVGHMGDARHTPPHYFQFPRNSGLPPGYFRPRVRWGVVFLWVFVCTFVLFATAG